MRYRELTEAKRSLSKYENERHFNALANFLSKEKLDKILAPCSEILQVYKNANGFLYRGMKPPDARPSLTAKSSVFVSTIRKNRKPVAIPSAYHTLYHKAFLDLGFEATRKNSIFTSTRGTAGSWGSGVYIIFPFNGFKYTWFEEQSSEYLYYPLESLIDNFKARHGKDYNDESLSPKLKVKFIEEAKQKLKELGIINENLEEAIQDGKEVLIAGTKYIAFRMDLEKHLRSYIGMGVPHEV